MWKIGLPKDVAKIFLGSVILLLSALIFLEISTANSHVSSLVLQSRENKFRVNFNIINKDESSFSQILQKLNLPQNTKKGFFFELDSTSAARLTFASPIKSDFKIEKDQIIFEGESSRNPLQDQFITQNFKIPKSANLAIAALNFKDFIRRKALLIRRKALLIESKSAVSSEFSDWINLNLSSSPGQYLVIFGQNADYAIIFKSQSIDFEPLKSIQILGEPIYFKESNQNTDFHIIKIPDPEANKSITFTIFQHENWNYITSSYEAAQELLSTQKGEKESIQFPNLPEEQIALAVLYRNQDEISATDNFFKLLFDAKPQFQNTLQNVKLFEFTLKSNGFSGLISVR